MDEIDTSVMHPARRYNYWLGGSDHFAADRAAGDQLEAAFPTVRLAARANRAFLRRAVRHVAQAGVRQFLDLGTGLPVPDNTHEIAQRADPTARVMYVDFDPIVATRAKALTTGTEQGRTAYLEADVRDPAAILANPVVRQTLDFGEPVALMMVAILHFLHDDEQAYRIVRRLTAELPSGSYLILSNMTLDYSAPEDRAKHQELVDAGVSDVFPRSATRLGEFFTGFDLVEPGVVPVTDWRPDPDTHRMAAEDVAILGGVGVKN